jgi:decaprenylphospho-beta-D-erythro-pentofuranosid-2-ulose 2-reductase
VTAAKPKERLVIDALGRPRTVVLLGGTSEIALAIARAWRDARPNLVLAARPGRHRDTAVAELRTEGFEVDTVDFEALHTSTHPQLIDEIAESRDIDVAVVAFGVLGDQEEAWTDHRSAVHLATVDYTAAVSVGVCLAAVIRRQGHGTIVALSSVAGERIRRANFVYGSAKAGMDGFYLGLGEALREYGGHVLVVRPGFVRTAMSAGRSEPPLAVDADDVARAVVAGVADRSELIWVPRRLRPVMSGLRHLPRPIFRRIPG